MAAKQKRRFVVQWEQLETMIPMGTDAKSKQRRLSLFKEFDADNNGLMHQTEAVRSFFRLIPRVGGISDLRPAWMNCFRIARECVEPIVPIGSDFVEQNQFRALIISFWYYLKLWDCFLQTSPGDDVSVEFCDLERIPEIFKDSAITDLRRFEDNLHAAFAHSERSLIPFDKLVDMVLRIALPALATVDAEAEKQEAERQLRRIQPHLWTMPTAKNVRRAHSLDTLQPYQVKRKESSAAAPQDATKPRMVDPYQSMRWQLLNVPIKGSVNTKHLESTRKPIDMKATQRWNTQYMSAYTPAQPRNAPHMVDDSLTPKATVPWGGAVMPRSGSLPELPRTTLRHADRNEVQQRLHGQLEMCSTGQMRSLLKAAGGMALARR